MHANSKFLTATFPQFWKSVFSFFSLVHTLCKLSGLRFLSFLEVLDAFCTFICVIITHRHFPRVSWSLVCHTEILHIQAIFKKLSRLRFDWCPVSFLVLKRLKVQNGSPGSQESENHRCTPVRNFCRQHFKNLSNQRFAYFIQIFALQTFTKSYFSSLKLSDAFAPALELLV